MGKSVVQRALSVSPGGLCGVCGAAVLVDMHGRARWHSAKDGNATGSAALEPASVRRARPSRKPLARWVMQSAILALTIAKDHRPGSSCLRDFRGHQVADPFHVRDDEDDRAPRVCGSRGAPSAWRPREPPGRQEPTEDPPLARLRLR